VHFEVLEQRNGAAHVLAVKGELDLDTAGELRRRLSSMDSVPIVIDLSGCEFMDSTGVALIVTASRRHNGGGGFAVVAEPGSQARRTLRLTNVDSRIPVLGSLEAALASISANA
jgi:anti-sigma B factor antagonist